MNKEEKQFGNYVYGMTGKTMNITQEVREEINRLANLAESQEIYRDTDGVLLRCERNDNN